MWLGDLDAALTHVGVIFPDGYGLLVCFVVVHKDSGRFMEQPIWLQLAPSLLNFQKNVKFFDTFDFRSASLFLACSHSMVKRSIVI